LLFRGAGTARGPGHRSPPIYGTAARGSSGDRSGIAGRGPVSSDQNPAGKRGLTSGCRRARRDHSSLGGHGVRHHPRDVRHQRRGTTGPRPGSSPAPVSGTVPQRRPARPARAIAGHREGTVERLARNHSRSAGSRSRSPGRSRRGGLRLADCQSRLAAASPPPGGEQAAIERAAMRTLGRLADRSLSPPGQGQESHRVPADHDSRFGRRPLRARPLGPSQTTLGPAGALAASCLRHHPTPRNH
jgi:hypothetical protein